MKITIENLAAGYPPSGSRRRERLVLRDVDARAAPGRVTAVIGPNASGKSTLLRCVIGALRPVAGTVRLDGTPAHRLRGRALAARLAYVPQRAVVSAAFTVREIVDLGRFALPRAPARVDAAIERMELEAIADRPFPALSVGQQQRVGLARALAQLEPGAGCLVLDEPTASMDLRHAHHCFGVLRLLADQGTAVLVAVHDLPSAAAFADDVWLLAPDEGEEGVTVGAAVGPVTEVMQVDRLGAVFGVRFRWIEREAGGRVLSVDPFGG